MIDDVYNAKILGFAGNIGRIGRLANPDATATAHSKLCGSTVTIDLKMNDGVVTDFGHVVKACALGQASSSIMASHVVGATADELRVCDLETGRLRVGAEATGSWGRPDARLCAVTAGASVDVWSLESGSKLGAWRLGRKHGQGRLTWAGGDGWEGEFRDDQQTDNGKGFDAPK